MAEEIKEFELNCPICDNTHTYPVSIDSSPIFYSMTPNMDTSPKTKRFKRAFICVETGERFQATLKIIEHFGQIINSVNVK